MDYDCAVIGAGPAGLHCGTYLGRYLRSCVIFDGGRPRASWIPATHNFPCFPSGLPGNELLAKLRQQTLMYGAQIRRERVASIEAVDGTFTVRTDSSDTVVRKVVFATGVWDIPPHVPDADHYKGTTIRHCPICDAYESRGRKLVLFGSGNHAAMEALWMAHYSDDPAILTCGHGTRSEIDPQLLKRLDEKGIPIIEQPVVGIEENGDELGTVLLEDGAKIESVFRGYSTMGLKPHSDVARKMGIGLDPEGYIKVDQDQQTNMPGVYAVGDIVSGDVAQIVVAFGHVAIATIHIHNSLR